MTKYTNTLPDSPITSVTIMNNSTTGPYLVIKHKQDNIMRTISGPAIAKFVNETCVQGKNIIDSDSIDQIIQKLENIIEPDGDTYRYTGTQEVETDITSESSGGFTRIHSKPSYTSDSLSFNQEPENTMLFYITFDHLTAFNPDEATDILLEAIISQITRTNLAGDHNPGE